MYIYFNFCIQHSNFSCVWALRCPLIMTWIWRCKIYRYVYQTYIGLDCMTRDLSGVETKKSTTCTVNSMFVPVWNYSNSKPYFHWWGHSSFSVELCLATGIADVLVVWWEVRVPSAWYQVPVCKMILCQTLRTGISLSDCYNPQRSTVNGQRSTVQP